MGTTMLKLITLILGVAFIIALIAIGPLLMIWALNTLFPVLAIGYTWETWISVIIVTGLFKTNINVKK
jgi:hypothetical protein